VHHLDVEPWARSKDEACRGRIDAHVDRRLASREARACSATVSGAVWTFLFEAGLGSTGTQARRRPPPKTPGSGEISHELGL
jgi:hypothetical protein